MEAKHNADHYVGVDRIVKHHRSEVRIQWNAVASSAERKRHTGGVQPRPEDFDRRPVASRDRYPWRR